MGISLWLLEIQEALNIAQLAVETYSRIKQKRKKIDASTSNNVMCQTMTSACLYNTHLCRSCHFHLGGFSSHFSGAHLVLSILIKSMIFRSALRFCFCVIFITLKCVFGDTMNFRSFRSPAYITTHNTQHSIYFACCNSINCTCSRSFVTRKNSNNNAMDVDLLQLLPQKTSNNNGFTFYVTDDSAYFMLHSNVSPGFSFAIFRFVRSNFFDIVHAIE